MTDTADRKSFLGVPVSGEIDTRSHRLVPPRPLSELEPLFRAVLEDPYIREFGWTQYTPYFNDGDPCYFRVGDMWVLTVDDPSDEEIEEEGIDVEEYSVIYGHQTLGDIDRKWVTREDGARERVDAGYTGTRPEEFARAYALARAIDSEAFDAELLAAFGDHATVMITREGITVEHYEHD